MCLLLHLHTHQSDGFSSVKEVINTYHKAGYSIISITDHDWNRPNARVEWKQLSKEEKSPYPKNPKPYNYPANPTWPWEDYGVEKEDEGELLGIQGNELTFRYHINSYFSDYGVWYEKTGNKAPFGGIVDSKGNEVTEDMQILGIKEKKGLAIINHP